MYAITPTLPTLTAVTVQELGLKLPVLSDVGNVVAKQYGTLYQLDEDLSKLQTKLGVQWEKLYGDNLHQLPHAGFFRGGEGDGEGSVQLREAGLQDQARPVGDRGSAQDTQRDGSCAVRATSDSVRSICVEVTGRVKEEESGQVTGSGTAQQCDQRAREVRRKGGTGRNRNCEVHTFRVSTKLRTSDRQCRDLRRPPSCKTRHADIVEVIRGVCLSSSAC